MTTERLHTQAAQHAADDAAALVASQAAAELCRKLGRHPNAIGARCAKIGIEAHGRHGADALQRTWLGTV